MWQRFTEIARRTVFFAQEEAQSLGDHCVTSDHLLLGLLRTNEGIWLGVFELMGVSEQDIREEVRSRMPKTGKKDLLDMTLTPDAKMVIDMAYAEARELNNGYIGTEHLLLGIMRLPQGIGAEVLRKHFDIDMVRTKVLELQMQDGRTPSAKPEPRWSIGAKPKIGTSILDHLTYRAQIALYRANRLAVTKGSSGITDVHLVCSTLLDSKSVCARLVSSLEVSPEGLGEQLLDQIKVGFAEGSAKLPLDRSGDRLFNASVSVSKAMGDLIIGTEHMLLGALSDSTSLPAVTAAQHGISYDVALRAAAVIRNDESQEADEVELEQIKRS